MFSRAAATISTPIIFVGTWQCFGQGLQKKNLLSTSAVCSLLLIFSASEPLLLRLLPILLLGCPISQLLLLLMWCSLNCLVVRTSFGQCCPSRQLPSRFAFSSGVFWPCSFVGFRLLHSWDGGSTIFRSCSYTLRAAAKRLPCTPLAARIRILHVKVPFVSFKQLEALGSSSI